MLIPIAGLFDAMIVNDVADDVMRPMFNLLKNAANVFANDTNRQELYSGEEENDHYNGGKSTRSIGY